MMSPPDLAGPALVALDALIDAEAVQRTDALDALSTETGRAYLVDALLLRREFAKRCAAPAVPVTRRPGRPRLVAAAAVFLAAGAGLAMGAALWRTDAMPIDDQRLVIDSAAPPEPTVVIPLRPGIEWTEVSGGD